MLNHEKIKNNEINTYMKHGADHNLAEAMSALFSPISYNPTIQDLDERIEQSSTTLDYQHRSFDMFLRGETEQAREYMVKSVELREVNDGARYGRVILDNLGEVQDIVTKSLNHFNKLRVEKGYEPLAYLDFD